MRLVVGRIGKAQGLRGEVTVEVRTDSPELRFAPDASLFSVAPDGSAGPVLTVLDSRWHSGRLVLSLVGVEDRSAAEELRGLVLESEVDVAMSTEEDEFHDQALIGLVARDGRGNEVGEVREIVHLPGQDLLRLVPTGSGDEDTGTVDVLVPFVRSIVPTVDVAGGFVVVDLPEGLADLGRP